uniref:hypothetical protein n=1 Tax=Pseudomonas aeruginosa TaxID=287 RepID=UPI0038915251
MTHAHSTPNRARQRPALRLVGTKDLSRDDWLAVGGFDEARQAQFEDWDFWIALVGCGVRGRL